MVRIKQNVTRVIAMIMHVNGNKNEEKTEKDHASEGKDEEKREKYDSNDDKGDKKRKRSCQ